MLFKASAFTQENPEDFRKRKQHKFDNDPESQRQKAIIQGPLMNNVKLFKQ